MTGIAWGIYYLGAATIPMEGRLAFASVFALLIVWLVLIPRTRLAVRESPTGKRRAAWRDARLWAIAVAVIQLLFYLLWPS